MDEKSSWECDMMSRGKMPRDNLPHPLVQQIAPQGDSCFLWAEAHEKSFMAKAVSSGEC